MGDLGEGIPDFDFSRVEQAEARARLCLVGQEFHAVIARLAYRSRGKQTSETLAAAKLQLLDLYWTHRAGASMEHRDRVRHEPQGRLCLLGVFNMELERIKALERTIVPPPLTAAHRPALRQRVASPALARQQLQDTIMGVMRGAKQEQ